MMQRIFKIFLYPYRQSHPDFCKAMEALFKADCAGQSGIIGRLGALFRMIYDIVRTKPNQGRIPRFGLVLSSYIIRTFPVWGGWVIAIAAIALLGWNWYHTRPAPAIALPQPACVISDREMLRSAIKADMLAAATQTHTTLPVTKLREQAGQGSEQPGQNQVDPKVGGVSPTPNDIRSTVEPTTGQSATSTLTPATQTPAITSKAIHSPTPQVPPALAPTMPAPAALPVPTNTPLPTSTAVPTSTPKPANTAAPTRRVVPTNQPTATPIATNTPKSTAIPTSTLQATPVPTSLPTATLNPSETSTPTPLNTATPTSTQTPLPSVVPSATPTCENGARRPVDVILTLDRSTSMAGQKLEKARDAAKDFIGALDLNQDQIGLVTFAREAELVQPLTNNGSAVATALDHLTPSKNTNMASAIISATAELTSERHHIGALPVIVLLSDGRTDPEAAQQAADLARQQGIRLITIGLGTNANEALLKAIAWEPDYYYAAPTPEQLKGIYTSIAGAVHSCDAMNGKQATPNPINTPTATLVPEPTVSPTSTPSVLPTETRGLSPSPEPATSPTSTPDVWLTAQDEPPEQTSTPQQSLS